MRADTKITGKDALEVASADERAAKVQMALEAIDQAGRGLLRVKGQLLSGVPRGNEVHYLIIAQGYVNEAAFAISELKIPPAAPEESAVKLVV